MKGKNLAGGRDEPVNKNPKPIPVEHHRAKATHKKPAIWPGLWRGYGPLTMELDE